MLLKLEIWICRHKKRAIGTLDVAFKKRFLEFTNNPSAKNAMEAGAYDGADHGNNHTGGGHGHHGGGPQGHHKNGSRKSGGLSGPDKNPFPQMVADKLKAELQLLDSEDTNF